EDDERLLAGRVVIKQVGDLLALKIAPQFLLGEGYGRRTLRPVAGRDRENIRIAFTVARSGGAEAGGGAEDFVFLELLGQCGRLWRAIEALLHGALLLEALVRLHGRRHLVLVIDLEHADLVTFDAALAVH